MPIPEATFKIWNPDNRLISSTIKSDKTSIWIKSRTWEPALTSKLLLFLIALIKDGNNLELTHGLNGIRNTAKNKIQEVVGGRKDYKIDCLAADFKDWEISW